MRPIAAPDLTMASQGTMTTLKVGSFHAGRQYLALCWQRGRVLFRWEWKGHDLGAGQNSGGAEGGGAGADRDVLVQGPENHVIVPNSFLLCL